MKNLHIVIGHLGKDPQIKNFESGNKVAQFSVATTESYKDKQSGEWKKNTNWINITCWGGAATYAEKYLKKGNQVYVEGKVVTRDYADGNGNKKYITETVASTVRSLERKASGEAQSVPPPPDTSNVGADTASAGGFPVDDDLPF